jgi:hypothetical protein
MTKYILILILFILPSLALGQPLPVDYEDKKESKKKSRFMFDNVTLTFGNWMEFIGDIQTNKSGTRNSFFDFDLNPYFAVAVDYPLKEQWAKWSLIPEIGYVVQRDADDSRIKKNLFFVRADAAYKLNDWLRLRAGTSLMILNISGRGGEETLPNANTTEVYYMPSERRTALNQTLDFGVEAIKDRMSARLSSYIYAWNESEERMITYSLSLSYLIPLKEM